MVRVKNDCTALHETETETENGKKLFPRKTRENTVVTREDTSRERGSLKPGEAIPGYRRLGEKLLPSSNKETCMKTSRVD